MKGGYFDTVDKREVTEDECFAALKEFRPMIEFFQCADSKLFQVSLSDFRALTQLAIDGWAIYKNYRAQDK